MKQKLLMILRGERPVIDIWHYIIGNLRYKLYYAPVTMELYDITGKRIKNPFMRQHIWEQINYRLQHMNKECYDQGSCIKCGCETTQLQMANKKCDGNCYPPMMSKKVWNKFKTTL